MFKNDTLSLSSFPDKSVKKLSLSSLCWLVGRSWWFPGLAIQIFRSRALILLSEAQKRTRDAFTLRISGAATRERSNFNERMHRRVRMCTEVKDTHVEYFSYPRNRRLGKGLFNYSLKYSYVQYWVSLCRVWGRQSGTGTGFPRVLHFLHHYHCTSAPYSCYLHVHDAFIEDWKP